MYVTSIFTSFLFHLACNPSHIAQFTGDIFSVLSTFKIKYIFCFNMKCNPSRVKLNAISLYIIYHLSNHHRSTIKLLSYYYQTAIEHLLNHYRTAIESLHTTNELLHTIIGLLSDRYQITIEPLHTAIRPLSNIY